MGELYWELGVEVEVEVSIKVEVSIQIVYEIWLTSLKYWMDEFHWRSEL